MIWVILLVAAALVLYFAFGRKAAPQELKQGPREQALSPKAERPKAPKRDGQKAPAQEVKAALEEEDIPLEPDESEPIPSAPAASRPSLDHVRDVDGLRRGLARARDDEGFFGKLRALITGRKEISPAIAEDIEEILLASDVGVSTTQAMLERIKETLAKSDLLDADKVWEAVRAEATRILSEAGETGAFALRAKPTVVLLVGVNGAGKTTTIGKLATKLKNRGRVCVLAAGDTFRAAAVQQLVVWGERVGAEVVRGKDGADPASVIFDAIKRAQEIGADVVLADTAGRLHTKSNLMEEMKKVVRTTEKAMGGAPHEILLVIDSTNGQNAMAQAKEFKEALPLTGIVLTKLDGTAKGGVILGICDSLHLPVRFVGLGERADDLHDFVPSEFVEALLGKEREADAA